MRRGPFGPKSLKAVGRKRTGLGPRIEALEGRLLLTTIPVTSNADDDVQGTLRYAIRTANETPGSDTILFAIPGTGVQTITPQTPLPAITDPVIIDGNSQGLASGLPLVQIDGSATTGSDGLSFTNTAAGSSVRGLIIGNFDGAGVLVQGAGSFTMTNMLLGTDPTATTAVPNGVGLRMVNATNATIGGLNSGDRNVISGNTGAGVEIVGPTTNQVSVLANYIGLSVSGNTAVPNGGAGIAITGDGSANSGARNVTVGGTTAVQRNYISGNVGPGILISDAGSSNNQVQGNYIGTNSSGTSSIPNQIGVQVANGATSNTVGGTSSSFRNVISGNTQAGVDIVGSSSNQVSSNFIGTNSTATAALTGQPAGVFVRDGSSSNTIGGSFSGTGNVISGNSGVGVWIRGNTDPNGTKSDKNILSGNFIGTNSGGSAAIPNGHGVLVSQDATNTTIGGTSTVNRNVISGNTLNGIQVAGADTLGTLVQGNAIGVANDQTTGLGNGGAGIYFDSASNTTVGGGATGASNKIAFNTGAGVRMPAGINNVISRNSIYSNGALGIDLAAEGVTPNDPQDPDLGANLQQNYPILTSVKTTGSTTTISGTLNSLPNTTFVLEFYSSGTADPSGYGEGQTYVGSTTVTTGADGNATFTYAAPSAVPTDAYVSALAIQQVNSLLLTNTSEFAQSVQNTVPSTDVSVTMTASSPSQGQGGLVGTGSYLTYTLTVTNSGPEAATGVTLTDTLPTGVSFLGAQAPQGSLSQSGSTVTFNLGDLAVGASVQATITVVTPSTLPNPPTITNTATVALGSGQNNSNTTTNTASLTTILTQGINLQLTQTATPSPSSVGQETTFVLTVTNNSTVGASNVVITDTLPQNFQYLSATTTQGSISGSNGQLIINLGNVPPVSTSPNGYSARVTITGKPTATGSITNSAVVNADQPVSVPNANVSSQTVQVNNATPTSDVAPVVLNAVRRGRGLAPSQVIVYFNEALDQTTAQNLANYQLDAVFARRTRPIPLASAVYDATAQTVTLTSKRPYSLHLLTQLTIDATSPGGVTGTNGLLLDGNNDGQPGGNFVARLKGYSLVPMTPTTGSGASTSAAHVAAVDAALGSIGRVGRVHRKARG